MFASKLIFVTIVLFIIYKTFASYQKKHLSKYFTILWLGFWFSILFFLLEQQILGRLAELLGIGRGVDLALYISIIVIFYLIYVILIKINQIENQMTKIIRELSIKKIQK